MVILDCSISKLFRGQKLVIKNSRIQVCQGDRVYLKGLNGVGKTSLLLALSNQLDFKGFLHKEMRALYIPPKGVFFDFLTPEENSRILLLKDITSPKEIMLNLSAGQRIFWELSILINSSDIIYLLDDCLSYLDSELLQIIFNLISKLNRTCIFASQDERVSNFATKIYEIRDKKIFQSS